ncbi:hypothetical protein [Rhizorhapis suberifaciens]|uniref:Uncharacterized protein n=1 Tax=Rhizorhapis suberifaciens TaxID=13656 RepID=A0A840HYE0_9SPHN|nr:hypothetical protein [Rhizorhapis suberifaciens]MBB4642671.1 hypothetical protein [Rhizorhapis suberifaciens]
MRRFARGNTVAGTASESIVMDGTLFEYSVQKIEQELSSYLDHALSRRVGAADPEAARKTQRDLVSGVLAELLGQSKTHADDLAAREILQALWSLRCLCAGEPNHVAEQPSGALYVLARCMVARRSTTPDSVRNAARSAMGSTRISIFDDAVMLEWITK